MYVGDIFFLDQRGSKWRELPTTQFRIVHFRSLDLLGLLVMIRSETGLRIMCSSMLGCGASVVLDA